MKRTIFLRAACKFPTEQMSFSVLNVEELLHSPYGQFIFSLWRGSENRENLSRHGSKYHQQLESLLLNGAEFTLPNGERERMNVIPIMCADLGYMKEILGKCLSTSKYGCYYCKKPLKEWGSQKVLTAESLSMKEMVTSGKLGEEVLGIHPDHKLRDFTDFQQTHYGQYATPLFTGFDILTMPPCGMHMILAHHRYLWSFLSDVIQRRNQGNLKSTGFKNIGCTYLAFQFEAYLKSKNKYYDGSATLKMIGEDCKQLEENIEKFVLTFLRDGENIGDKSCETLHHAITLYHLLEKYCCKYTEHNI